jgi:hypothetical protein
VLAALLLGQAAAHQGNFIVSGWRGVLSRFSPEVDERLSNAALKRAYYRRKTADGAGAQ